MMKLLEMSDSQILEVAEPILNDIVTGSNNKDWEQFSRHMSKKHINNPEVRASVEKQWQENEHLTSLSDSSSFLGVIRKQNNVLVLWKQTSSATEDEYLEKLYLQEIDGDIKQAGTWIE